MPDVIVKDGWDGAVGGGNTIGSTPKGRGIVVGLTGGIATGKSMAAQMFAELGAVVISADEVARQIVEPGQPALVEIREAFGEDVLLPDGSLNRQALGNLVFEDEGARRRLESITHPPIRLRMRDLIEKAVAEGRTVVAEIPLLFESGKTWSFIDTTVVVDARQEIQKSRLMARNDLTEAEALARMATQMPMVEKVARANYVIHNNGSERQLRRQVESVWHRLHEEQEMT